MAPSYHSSQRGNLLRHTSLRAGRQPSTYTHVRLGLPARSRLVWLATCPCASVPTDPIRKTLLGSRRDPGEGALVTGLLDPLQLGLHAIQSARRLVVLVARVGEMAADHVEGVAELVEVPAQAGEPRLDLLRAPLDLQPLEPEDDHAQVGVEAVEGEGYDGLGGLVDGGGGLLHCR